jgi:ABC-type multidrug transport system fused ATPase/permease subunit
MTVSSLLLKHKKPILLVASLILVENIAWIAEPTLFGNLIDAFISKASGEKVVGSYGHIVSLIFWVTAYLINSGSGTIRRNYEPKVFQKIYIELVTDIAQAGQKIGLDTSRIAARAHLSQEYVTFVQYRIPEIAEQSISILGAVIALSFYDFRISLACLCISIPLLILSTLYSRNVVKLHSELHDTYESVYTIFSKNEPAQVTTVYSSMARIQQTIAGWGAANFGIMRLVLLLIFLFVLYIAIDLDDFTTGNIYSIVAYLWTFVTSVEYIPELLESITSLKDLSNRLKTGE